MLTCPMCKNSVDAVEAHCPRCQADLSLLCSFRDCVGEGLARADACLRNGALDGAVWAYLDVLEVDPDNPVARQQVAQVVTTIRHFDRVAPSRRWLKRIHRKERNARWVEIAQKVLACIALLAAIGGVAYYFGYQAGARQTSTTAGQ